MNEEKGKFLVDCGIMRKTERELMLKNGHKDLLSENSKEGDSILCYLHYSPMKSSSN